MNSTTPLTELPKLIIQPSDQEAYQCLTQSGFQPIPCIHQLIYRIVPTDQLSDIFLQLSQVLSETAQAHSRYCITRSQLDSHSLLLEFLDARPLSTITISAKHSWFLRILAQQRLYFDYQPIFDLQTGQIIAYECLARAISEQGDRRFTGQQLIDGAMSLSLTHEFDDLALETCLQAIAQLNTTKTFYINLLPNAIISNPNFLEQIQCYVNELGLNPRRITFELTEVQALIHHQSLHQLIDEIRSLGFGVAIDDLYGNVAVNHYFMEFRPDVIKIDRLLIAGCSQHPMKQIMVTNLLRSAHDLGIPVLAEGLENQLDIQFCREAGIDYGQGFGLARPQSYLQQVPLDWCAVLSQC